jgi:hypothetical protein
MKSKLQSLPAGGQGWTSDLASGLGRPTRVVAESAAAVAE